MTMNQFQPTLPARGATLRSINRATVELISTHAPRTGSDPREGCNGSAASVISTHAPRTGSDTMGYVLDGVLVSISTHAPRTGSDRCVCARWTTWRHFNPRSPHGERRLLRGAVRLGQQISTHAPRTGSDQAAAEAQKRDKISTHAPRTGSDADAVAERVAVKISTHAPRTGSDDVPPPCVAECVAFQPTLPARGATEVRRAAAAHHRISTHAPRTGSDANSARASRTPAISTHAPRTGSDTPDDDRCTVAAEFQPTLPARGATW